jgi:hypothetical protein
MAIANESIASQQLWRGFDREALLSGLLTNSRDNAATGRLSEGYSYAVPGLWNGRGDSPQVIGDKVWNPATLLLHGDHALLPHLEATIGAPLFLIHTVRNPFDVITTMSKRSGAPLADRSRWFFMHCDAVAAIRDRWPRERYLDLRHEDLLSATEATLSGLCRFLGQEAPRDFLEGCARFLFSAPTRPRANCSWDRATKAQVSRRMSEYDFLEGYAFDT